MACAKTLTTMDDLDATVIVLVEPRPCSGCKAPTITATRLQRTGGRCLACMRLPITADLAEQLGTRAENLVLDALPVETIIVDYAPPVMKPNSYHGSQQVVVTARWIGSGRLARFTVDTPFLDAGPCSLCRGVILRYGSTGRALCSECEVLT